MRDELLKEERPDTLTQYMSCAIAIDRQLFERRMDRKASSFQQRPVNEHRSPNPSARDPDAMDIDAAQVRSAPGAPRGRLSPAERARRIREKLCLYCGMAGHMVSACPSKN